MQSWFLKGYHQFTSHFGFVTYSVKIGRQVVYFTRPNHEPVDYILATYILEPLMKHINFIHALTLEYILKAHEFSIRAYQNFIYFEWVKMCSVTGSARRRMNILLVSWKIYKMSFFITWTESIPESFCCTLFVLSSHLNMKCWFDVCVLSGESWLGHTCSSGSWGPIFRSSEPASGLSQSLSASADFCFELVHSLRRFLSGI